MQCVFTLEQLVVNLMSRTRTYSELMSLRTHEERFDYLSLRGHVGRDTFGFDRYLNQQFYRSDAWKRIRQQVILRDNSCDMGLEGYDIFGTVYVHHMNPLTKGDILDSSEYLLNPEYLICVSRETHDAIHYGNKDILPYNRLVTRAPNDQTPWKK